MQFRRWAGVLVIGALLAGCSGGETIMENDAPPQPEKTVAETPTLMGWGDLLSRPRPDPQTSLSYGPLDQNLVDLWLPEGDGPHPVVLMIHGGCWQKAIADRTLMNYAAEDLRQRGLAVWNVEYRGVDEDGGGYPGTFLDVTAAAQVLFERGPELGLDTDRVVGFGHSAGGHLITWLAGRAHLSPESPLYDAGQTFDLKALINSGGLADLEASSPVTLDTCLAAIEDKLTGAPSEGRPDVYSDTSSSRLQPGKGIQISVNGDQDRIAPPSLGQGFTQTVLDAGGRAQFVKVANSGHVELVSPGTAAWEKQVELIMAHLGDELAAFRNHQ